MTTVDCGGCGAPLAEARAGVRCAYCGVAYAEPPPPVAPPAKRGLGRPLAIGCGATLLAGVVAVVALVVVAARAGQDALQTVAVGEPGTPAVPGAAGPGAAVPLSGPRIVLDVSGGLTLRRGAPVESSQCATGEVWNLNVDFGQGARAEMHLAPGTDGPGSWPLGGGFRVEVRQVTGGTTASWTSARPGAAGTIERRPDGSMIATFTGLQPESGSASGTVSGVAQLLCA